MKDQFSDLLGQASEISTKTLIEYLKSSEPDENGTLTKKARVASSVLASRIRWEQTTSSREKTVIGLARSLARDRDQLAEYVKITMPDSNIVKALPKPSK